MPRIVLSQPARPLYDWSMKLIEIPFGLVASRRRRISPLQSSVPASMPIKFRCQHCDQFLGIARSRAGDLVDCPRCGRMLRVPGEPATVAPAAAKDRHEDSLASALSELSALAEGRLPGELPAPPEVEPVIHAAPVENIAATPVKIEAVQAPVTEVPVPLAEDFGTPIDDGHVDEKLTTGDGLAELAAISGQRTTGEISPALLDEMRSVSRGTSQTVATLVGGLCLLLLGGASGWYLAQSDNRASLPFFSPTTARQSAPEVESSPNPPAANEAERVITGSVSFSTESVQSQPDAGAMILILPVKHPGTLILNSQSLIRGADHADFKATAAALASLGGRIVRAADDGSFATSIAPESDFIAIAISQHVARSDDLPVAAEISSVLKTWFDSPSRLAGRRAATASPLAADTSDLKLVFPAQ